MNTGLSRGGEANVTNFMNNFEGFPTRAWVYRVWVSLHDEGRAALISIGIDPTMAASNHSFTGRASASRRQANVPPQKIEDPPGGIAVAANRVDAAAETIS